MTNKIGSKYTENLMQIKHYINYITLGNFQETPEITCEIQPGRCYYDKCSEKNFKADRVISISHNNGERIEQYHFHSVCLEDLSQDKRFPSMN